MAVFLLLLTGLIAVNAKATDGVRLFRRDSIDSRGLVEVFHNGNWRRVYANDWDIRNTNVVCRQLGFSGASSLFTSPNFMGMVRTRWWCVGNETSLTACDHNSWGMSYCSQVAGVVCTTARLVGGRTSSEGLVQVYYYNNWGWVCADQWDKQDADVACRMMHFDGSLSVGSENEKRTERKFPVWLNNLQCTGNESSLFSCVQSGLGFFDWGEKRKARVTCTPRVRLVGWGNLTSQGRVEVFYSGRWGTVCGLQWDLLVAGVVCRELGFKGALGAGLDSERVNATRWFRNVRCVGSEISITKCDHNGWSDYCYWWPGRRMWSAAVVCTTDQLEELSTEPQTTDPRDENSSNPQTTTPSKPTASEMTVIVLGVLLSISITAICFLIWRKRRHSKSHKNDTEAERGQDNGERHVNKGSSSTTVRETEHSYFELGSRTPQDQVTTERHYQELLRTIDSIEYEITCMGRHHRDYEASCNTYEEVSPRTA